MLEYPLQYNGLSLNDQNLRDFRVQPWWIELTSIDGLWDADVRDERQVLPNRSGELSGTILYAGKTITLTGEVRAQNILGLREGQRALQLAFGDLEEHQLFFQTYLDPQALFIKCKKNNRLAMSEEQPTAKISRPFTVTLRADDPRVYSSVEQRLDVSGTEFGTTRKRRAYPRAYTIQRQGQPNRRAYAIFQPGGFLNAENNGTAETYPFTIINGPMNNPFLKNLTTKKQLSWSGLDLASGETLTVDHYTGQILLNDVIVHYTGFDVAQSDFWPLVPGQNIIAVDAFSRGAGAGATMFWRDAFR